MIHEIKTSAYLQRHRVFEKRLLFGEYEIIQSNHYLKLLLLIYLLSNFILTTLLEYKYIFNLKQKEDIFST